MQPPRVVETQGAYLGENGLSVEEVRDNWDRIADPAGQQTLSQAVEQIGKLLGKVQAG